MANSLNRVTLIGNLGKDPEVNVLNNGSRVAKFSVATTESYKDKQGNWQSITDWHNVSAWDNLADRAQKDLKKGSKVFVEGKLKTRSYQDKDGNTRYVTEVSALSIITFAPGGGNYGGDSEYGSQSGSSEEGSYSNTSSSTTNFDDIDDDDVPF